MSRPTPSSGSDEPNDDRDFDREEPFAEWPTMFAPIPRSFKSEETGAPFESCIECGRELLDDGTAYLIQKCSNGREVVFEFALCLVCAERLHSSYSEASRRAMLEFFSSRVDPASRAARLLGQEGDRKEAGAGFAAEETGVDAWTRECLTCARPPEPGKSFAMAALCDGTDLLLGHAPYLICESCEVAINELVSPETRGEWDRFIGRNFDLPPTLETLPTGGRLIVV